MGAFFANSATVGALGDGRPGVGLLLPFAALGTEVRMLKLPAQPEDAERLLDGLAH